ncbi:MAG: hypothetical protein V4568_11705 [Pseudomonadota bacterium]
MSLDSMPFVYVNQSELAKENRQYILDNDIKTASEHLGICLRSTFKWVATLLAGGYYKYDELDYAATKGKQHKSYDQEWDEIREDTSKGASPHEKIQSALTLASQTMSSWGEEFTDAAGGKFSIGLEPAFKSIHSDRTTPTQLSDLLAANSPALGTGMVIALSGTLKDGNTGAKTDEPIVHYVGLVNLPEGTFFFDINNGVWGEIKDGNDISAGLNAYVERVYTRWNLDSCDFFPMSAENVRESEAAMLVEKDLSPHAMNAVMLVNAQAKMQRNNYNEVINETFFDCDKLPLDKLAKNIKHLEEIKFHLENCLNWTTHINRKLMTLPEQRGPINDIPRINRALIKAKGVFEKHPENTGERTDSVTTAVVNDEITEAQLRALDIECGRRDAWRLISHDDLSAPYSGKAFAIDNPSIPTTYDPEKKDIAPKGDAYQIKSAFFEAGKDDAGNRQFVKISGDLMSPYTKHRIHNGRAIPLDKTEGKVASLLVGEELVTTNYVHEIISMVRKLDRGFPERMEITPSGIQQVAHPYAQAATSAYQKWNETKSDEALKEAHEAFRVACEAGKNDPNEVAHAEHLQIFGRICCLMKNPEEGVLALEKSVSLYEKHQYVRGGSASGLQSALTELCKAMVDVISVKKQQQGDSSAVEVEREKLRKYTQQATEIFYTTSGEVPIDTSAYRGEQGEVVFFKGKSVAVGTHGVHDCLAISIYHPVADVSAVIHLDECSSVASLRKVVFEEFFDQMPPATLEVSVVGASFPPGHSNKRAVEYSERNLVNLVKSIFNRRVKLVSAAIGDTHQPANIVAKVQPQTAAASQLQIKEAIPGIYNPDMALGGGRYRIAKWGKPLHVALDLTVCDRRAPILLQADEVADLKNQWGKKNIEEVYDWGKTNNITTGDRLPAEIGSIMAYREQYEIAVNHIKRELDETLQSLPVAPSPSFRRDAIRIIEEHAIHVGSEAKIANQPLVDFIKHGLFKGIATSDMTQLYTPDFAGLKAVKFDPQPIKAIRTAHERAMNYIEGKLDETIASLAGQNVVVTPEHRKQAIQTMKSHRIEIGEGADQRNQRLVNFINTELFVLRQSRHNDRSYILNVAGLKKLGQQQSATAQASTSQGGKSRGRGKTK